MERPFTDYTVDIDGHIFKLHRYVLYEKSGYFRALLSGHYSDSNTQVHVMQITYNKEVDIVFEQMYSDTELDINPSQIDNLLAWLDYFDVPWLRRKLVEYVTNNLDLNGRVFELLLRCDAFDMSAIAVLNMLQAKYKTRVIAMTDTLASFVEIAQALSETNLEKLIVDHPTAIDICIVWCIINVEKTPVIVRKMLERNILRYESNQILNASWHDIHPSKPKHPHTLLIFCHILFCIDVDQDVIGMIWCLLNQADATSKYYNELLRKKMMSYFNIQFEPAEKGLLYSQITEFIHNVRKCTALEQISILC